MPYITPTDRTVLDATMKDITKCPPQTAGELQYVVAQIVQSMIKDGFRYQDLNDIMGALYGANAEFYREVVAPYEDLKKAENGGVYNV